MLDESDDDSDDDILSIAIQPPKESREAETDKDSDGSDCEVTADPIHLPRRILAAEAEVSKRKEKEEVVSKSKEIEVTDDTDDVFTDPAMSGPSSSESRKPSKKKVTSRSFQRDVRCTNSSRKVDTNVPIYKSTMSPTQIDVLHSDKITPNKW